MSTGTRFEVQFACASLCTRYGAPLSCDHDVTRKHSIHAHTHEGSVSFLPASNTNVGRLTQPHLTVIKLKLGSMLLSKMPLGIVNCLFLWRTNIRESEPCSMDTYMGSYNSATLVQPRALHYGAHTSHASWKQKGEGRSEWFVTSAMCTWQP